MWETAQSPRSSVLPFIRCRDPGRSIAWLCRALGFETHHVALRDDGSIVFAHLRFGDSLIMVTPAGDAVAVPAIDAVAADGNALITPPAKIEHGETESCYFVVDDIEAHYRKAKEAGADIVLEIKIYEHGRRYSCRDPDGHVWTFGTYDFWREQDPPVSQTLLKFVRSAAILNLPAAVAGLRAALPATVSVLAVLAGCGVALWLAQAPPAGEAASTDAETQTVAAQQAELTEERYAREASERALSEARERLSREQESRDAAERVALELRDQLAEQPAANAESEKLAEERAARFAAEEAARAVKQELARANAEREKLAAAAAAAEQATVVVSQTAPADAEPEARIRASAVVTRPVNETATEEAASKSAGQEESELASSLLAEGRSILANGDATAAAAEQPTGVVSQTAPAEGEPQPQIRARAFVTQPAEEPAQPADNAESEKLEEARASRLAAEEAARAAQEELARARAAPAAAAEQPTEIVSQTAPADGEPTAPIGGRIVVTPPADETATEEAAPKSAGQDADQLASALLAEGRSLLAKGDLDGARRAFLRAADNGLAEAALALGSTYDPAILARSGLKGASADPESAKRWYRRAHELTQAAALKTKSVAHE
jgi:uncharacterized glyoxalase superfamily protein PhnB